MDSASASEAATAAITTMPLPEEAGSGGGHLGSLLLDAAIYEPPAERLRNYQQVGG